MTKQVRRVTMFKVKDEEGIQAILDKYANLQSLAKKDGKPYILGCVAGKTVPDPRNQGYNLMGQTTFASVEDMKYYDEECEAHGALKALAKTKIDPPALMLFMEVDA